MTSSSIPTPAFGQADLSNCEREQIHFAGSIQPHGALLLVHEPDYVVAQASANAAEFLGLDGDVLGRRIGDLEGDLLDRIAPHLDEPLHAIPIAIRCRVGGAGTEFDCLLHRPADGGLIIELERAGSPVDLSKHVELALKKIPTCATLRELCDEAARILRDLTGYDRVMVYRFDDQGHGEVFSEERREELESFLGNRYPASDIPQIARQLYVRNRVRVLVDVAYEPMPLIPRLCPLTGRDLDMSLCFLRSMSPIHIQYLKNMGVDATLVVSLVVGGQLWGLVACHHYVPKFVHYEVRTVCELLAETISTRIAALESFTQAQAEISVRRLEQRMIESVSPRRRLAERLVRQPTILASAAGRDRRRPAVRRAGADQRRRPQHTAIARCRSLAGRAARRGRRRNRLPGTRRTQIRAYRARRQRRSRRPGVKRPGRVSHLVPTGEGPHDHLGRQSVQAGRRRQ